MQTPNFAHKRNTKLVLKSYQKAAARDVNELSALVNKSCL